MNSQLNVVLHFPFVPTVLVLLYFFMAPTSIAVVNVLNSNTDQSSLLVLKDHITYDPNNFLSKNWSIETPVCHWIGITCGSSHLRVTALNLSYMGLVGTIPPHLGNLSFITRLLLDYNNFHGSLPSELARLRRLKVIKLSFNNFTGEIPSWFVLLPKIEDLRVGYNSFTGHITPSLFNITSLQSLDLRSNKLGGLLPPNFFQAPALQKLSVFDNQISGSIPSVGPNISSLQLIDLGWNYLSGEVPENMFYYLPELQLLSLERNQFSGKIPLSLFSCKHLQSVQFGVNSFEGSIPREFGNLTLLEELYLSANKWQEYGLEGMISRQGDVYSYGILLMEIFTGKKPTDEMFHGEFSIKHWVKDSYPDAIIDFIGGQLLTEGRRQLAVKKECLLSIMGLALDCSVDSPNERGNMKDVFAALKKIRIKFLNEPRNPRSSV